MGKGAGAGASRGVACPSEAEEGEEDRAQGCPFAAGRAGQGPGSLCGPLPLTAAAGEAPRLACPPRHPHGCCAPRALRAARRGGPAPSEDKDCLLEKRRVCR